MTAALAVAAVVVVYAAGLTLTYRLKYVDAYRRRWANGETL